MKSQSFLSEKIIGYFSEIPSKSKPEGSGNIFSSPSTRRYDSSSRTVVPFSLSLFPLPCGRSSRYTEHIGVSSPYHLPTLPTLR